MVGTIAVVNAGSHSLSLSVVDADDAVLNQRSLDIEPCGDEATHALDAFADALDGVDAIGHRLVHGGADVREHRLIDDVVFSSLAKAASLAPLHVPPALAAIDALRRRMPRLPQVACVDTAFHAALPEAAYTYAVPERWRTTLGVRRYGFHGLSYAWALERAAAMLGRPAVALRLVLAHLGGGASVCAVDHGVSVSTSMGMTPLEGLAMTKRSGSVDPGMLLWLQREHGMSAADISEALEHESGLLGLSAGLSADTRELVRASAANAQARLALDVYTLRIRQEVAAAAASLESLDGLVFTGEIGADQPEVREAVTGGLSVLGLSGGLATEQNEDGIISGARASIPVLLVHPREELQIAREVRRVLAR